MSPTIVILVVAACAASSCALLGTFLVLRRMAMLGDAISHAVLPGIVVAFLITGSRTPLPMVIGAGAVGVLTVFLVELTARTRRLREDASIGVVFPALFAIGVILVSRYAGQVDLDLDCVLYGEIAYSPWDLLFFRGEPIGPKALWVNSLILLLDLAFVLAFYKELKLTTFDPHLAATLGFAPTVMHYALMSLVSVTVVGAFESVGAILVVAMLVVPPATAYLLTDRLDRMLLLAVALGAGSAGVGYALARAWDASIAGAMASVSGIFFLFTFLGSPRHGLIAKLLRRRRVGRTMAEQLLLLHLQQDGARIAPAIVGQRFAWSQEQLDAVVERLRERGLIDLSEGGLGLTSAGESVLEQAGHLPLRHRLAEEQG